MPTADFGEKISFSSSKFTKLESKGDKIQFRVLNAPFYDGKHFYKKEDGSYDRPVPCPRINEGGECEECKLFFAAHKSAKKDGLDKKETDKLTSPHKPAISFYYPILNRNSGKFEIFQTTIGVRNQIEAQAELGTKILERDLIVVRKEVPGSGYYSLSVVDSSETDSLTKEEKEEVEKGKDVDLGDYVVGQREEKPEDIDIDL